MKTSNFVFLSMEHIGLTFGQEMVLPCLFKDVRIFLSSSANAFNRLNADCQGMRGDSLSEAVC